MFSRLTLPRAIHGSLFGAILVTISLFGAAHGQDSPRAFCVDAASLEIGSVHHIDAWPDGGALIGAERGLFLFRTRDGQLSVTRAGGADTGRVLTSHRLPGGALIGAWNGLFLARAASGAVNTTTVDADTGVVFLLQDLPGAGVLIGAEKGVLLAREAAGRVTAAPLETATGRVFEMFQYSANGVLIAAEKGWFIARGMNGKATLAPAGNADAGYARAIRSLPGIGLRIDAQAGWFLAREQGETVTVGAFGDAVTGRVGAVGDLPDGRMLLHTEKGWFTGNGAGADLVFARVKGPDVERVSRMVALRDGVLVYSKNGWFVAREKDGKVTFTPAGPFETTQFAQQFHEFPGGAVLIGDALKGLFVIRTSGSAPALARAGETDAGYVSLIREMAGGGALVGTRKGFFMAHDENGQIRLTSVNADKLADTGRVLTKPRYPGFVSHELPDGTVLIGAERGLFSAVPRACPRR